MSKAATEINASSDQHLGGAGADEPATEVPLLVAGGAATLGYAVIRLDRLIPHDTLNDPSVTGYPPGTTAQSCRDFRERE